MENNEDINQCDIIYTDYDNNTHYIPVKIDDVKKLVSTFTNIASIISTKNYGEDGIGLSNDEINKLIGE